LGAVLEAIYAIAALEADADGALLDEAVFLAGALAADCPREAEVAGLHALLLFLKGRRAAGRDQAGGYVPLGAQDCALWDDSAIDAAEAALARAAAIGRPGRFQLEAAIQSAHCWRRTGGATPWSAILALHDRLAVLAPTLGSEVARAHALGEVAGAAAALARLETLGAPAGFLPWHAARAHWLAAAGRGADARAAYGAAMLLARDPAARDWLAARRAGI
jgi:RNA polymerase sigma-70 factor (ECF subfamily)